MKKLELPFEEKVPTYVDVNGNFYRDNRQIYPFKQKCKSSAGSYLTLVKSDGTRTCLQALKLVYEAYSDVKVPKGTFVRAKDGNELNTHPSNIYLTTTQARTSSFFDIKSFGTKKCNVKLRGRSSTFRRVR